MSFKIRSKLIPKQGNNPGKRIKPDTIVIHYTAVPGCKAERLAECFVNNNGGYNQSCNYTVDWSEVICLIPAGNMSYGVTGHNEHIINIEVCYRDDSGGRFDLATIANLRELVRRLMRKWGIPADKVVRHYDLTGKKCPMFYAYDTNEWRELHRMITKGVV